MEEDFLYNDQYELMRSLTGLEGDRAAEIIEALNEFPIMYALPATEELIQSWYVLSKRLGVVDDEIVDPIVHGGIYDNEFVPFGFTRQEYGRNAAILEGWLSSEQLVLFEEQSWTTALYTFLANGCGGVCIDPGTEHVLRIPRDELSRIVALLTIRNFAGFENLALVRSSDGSICYAEGEETQVMVYDCDLSNEQVWNNIKNSVFPSQEVQIVVNPLPEVIKEVLHSKARQVVVNPGLRDARLYRKEELKSVFQHRLEGGLEN